MRPYKFIINEILTQCVHDTTINLSGAIEIKKPQLIKMFKARAKVFDIILTNYVNETLDLVPNEMWIAFRRILAIINDRDEGFFESVIENIDYDNLPSSITNENLNDVINDAIIELVTKPYAYMQLSIDIDKAIKHTDTKEQEELGEI